jgi:hypothetical protein
MAKKKEPAAKPAKATKTPTSRISWFDEKSHKPLIESYARRLNSFLDIMADGKVDVSELKAQEERLVTLMKEIEPQLADALHERVTQLLCELTAYDLMQMAHAMQDARPKAVFRG